MRGASHWSARRAGKARRGRPGSQETSLRPQARSPRGKGWLSCTTIAQPACWPVSSASRSPAPAVAAGRPTSTVRVEGQAATLRRGARPSDHDRRAVDKDGDQLVHRHQRGRRARGRRPAATGAALRLRQLRRRARSSARRTLRRANGDYWSFWVNDRAATTSASATSSCRRATRSCSRRPASTAAPTCAPPGLPARARRVPADGTRRRAGRPSTVVDATTATGAPASAGRAARGVRAAASTSRRAPTARRRSRSRRRASAR